MDVENWWNFGEIKKRGEIFLVLQKSHNLVHCSTFAKHDY